MKHITCSYVMSVFAMLLGALPLTISVVDTTGTDKTCVVGKSVSLYVSHRTNKTGATLVNGRLEKPRGENWNLTVDMETLACGSEKSSANVLSFQLTSTRNEKTEILSGLEKQQSATSTKKAVPPGYTLHGGFGYFRLGSSALNWTAARDACASEGAHLAFATSNEEAQMYTRDFDFNVEKTINKTWMWYGASDTAQEGTYVTVTGGPLEQSGYASFAQSLSGIIWRNCLFIRRTSTLLDDLQCSANLAYICKISI